MKLKEDLASNQPTYHYGGRMFTVSHVKVDLANRFERYKTHDATLASLCEIQSARPFELGSARQKLENMLAAKRQLEVDVEQLEAQFKMVEVAQTLSEHNIDDSQLGRVKDLIADIRTRLKVAERLASTPIIDGEIPVSASSRKPRISSTRSPSTSVSSQSRPKWPRFQRSRRTSCSCQN